MQPAQEFLEAMKRVRKFEEKERSEEIARLSRAEDHDDGWRRHQAYRVKYFAHVAWVFMLWSGLFLFVALLGAGMTLKVSLLFVGAWWMGIFSLMVAMKATTVRLHAGLYR